MIQRLIIFFLNIPVLGHYFEKIQASFFNTNRSSLVMKNITNSIGLKSLGILISLILIPLSINYVNSEQYGIWLTVSSVVAWMNSFDLGLGNGLRNKITADYALKKNEKGKIYVSTTYAMLIIIGLGFLLLFLLINKFVNWSEFFSIPKKYSSNINQIIILVIVCFCLQLVLQTIQVLLTAIHQTYKANGIQLMALIISLIGVLYLTWFTKGNLFYLVVVLAIAPVLSMVISSIYFFSTDLKFLRPAIKQINFKSSKGLFSTGWMFFIIQLGSLALYQTSNIIIAKVLGMEEVSIFNVVFKYFTALFMVVTVILNPYWSAFTDAFELKDYGWMRKNVNNLRMIFLIFVFISSICIWISPVIYNLWLGDSLSVPFIVTLSVGIYFMLFFWYNIHVTFIYGVGKLRIQMMAIIIGSIINIPISIFFGKTFGLPGVIIGNISVILFLGTITSIQVNKIINKTAKGLWYS